MEQSGYLSFREPDDFPRLREIFEKALYTDSQVLEVIGAKELPYMSQTDVPLLLRRTNGKTPLHTLIRLFLMETPCAAGEVKHAFSPFSIDTLINAGIVKADGPLMEAGVKILPFKDLYIAFDLPSMLRSANRKDYVMGIGSSTLTLANLTVRNQSRLTLDLGTGCGMHALLAAGHSDRVIAADLNPRAVKFADFNARLNNLSNIECVQGNLFGPVKDKKFDLVVTNPPFVISPETEYVYRDGGMEGDGITRKIVSQVPPYLREEGYCQILCNWAELHGRDWRERLQTWFEGSGCDVSVLRSQSLDAESYALTWIKNTEMSETGLFPERFETWMAYYEALGITSVGAGLITMRRSGGRTNRFRADDAPERMHGPCGKYIHRGFELADFLESVGDDTGLLNTPFRVSPDVRLDRRARPSSDGWADESCRLVMTRGFSYSGNIDPFIANMLVKCDGNRLLGELMDEMAVSLGTDADKMKESFCGIARNLVEKGFLLPNHFPE
ncbi:MAG: methyltransferase [Nitrospirota bacterium]